MSESSEHTMEKGSSSKKTVLIIVVSVAIVLLLCCCLVVGLGRAFFGTARTTLGATGTSSPGWNIWPFRGSLSFGFPFVEASRAFEQRIQDIDAALTVTVDNQVGKVQIVGSDTPSVLVTAEIRAYGTSADKAEEILDRVEVTADRVSASQVMVRGSFPRTLSQGRSPVVDLTIAVPRQTTVEVTTGVGDVSVRDLVGPVAVRTNVGEIDVDGVEGALHLRADVGELRVTDWVITGDSEVRTNVGRLRVAVNADAAFYLDAETNVGNIDSEFDVTGSQGRSRVPGDRLVGTVGTGPTIDLVLRAGTGQIDLRRGR